MTIRSTIVLPEASATWPAFKQQAVLLHEQAHARRGDFYVQLLAKLHQALSWFNPLAWWLSRRLVALAETASDDAALASIGDRAAYAGILLEVSRGVSHTSLGVAMARTPKLQDRVERILREKDVAGSPRPWARGALTLLILPLAALAACGVDATAELEQPSQTPALTQTAAAPAREERQLLVPSTPVVPPVPAAPPTGGPPSSAGPSRASLHAGETDAARLGRRRER